MIFVGIFSYDKENYQILLKNTKLFYENIHVIIKKIVLKKNLLLPTVILHFDVKPSTDLAGSGGFRK